MSEGKQYLYHRVPEEMESNKEGREVLYPLNMLKEKFPGLYELEIGKYQQPTDLDKRSTVSEKLIPTLEKAAWGDVIQFTAVHPEELKKALVEAGFHPKEMKFYQIDPELLDPNKTTVYLYQEGVEDESPDNFAPYDPKNLSEHAAIPGRTKAYYREKFQEGQAPLLFVGIPHVFHHGPVDVSNFPVITVSADKDQNFPDEGAFSKDEMKNILQDVIDNKFEVFDSEKMADYDADFSGGEPFFINIRSKQSGFGFGYIVFHDFLRRVGEGKTFISTDFTDAGKNLFQKAVRDGLIEKQSEPFGLNRLTRWKVTNDPVKNLEKMKDFLSK